MAKLITVDSKEWEIKYQRNKESLSFDTGTAVYNYPDFIGSKLYQNSTSSDRYSLTFTIHQNNLVAFKESLKLFVSEKDAIIHPVYGKLTNIVIEHPDWGAIQGKFVGSFGFGTSVEGDIPCRGNFQVDTPDNVLIKKDFDDENLQAVNSIDVETTTNFDVTLTAQDKNQIESLSGKLRQLYIDIQNSDVVAAFNDLNSELDKAILESQKIMNAVKKIISLPNSIFTSTRNKLGLLEKQSVVIKSTPVESYNIAVFNVNALSYNMGVTSRSVFVSEAAQEAAAGIKSVALN